jgi:hypothetical protein
VRAVAVVHGQPGVGKRTVADALGTRLRWPVLHAHDLHRPVGEALGWNQPPFLAVRDALLGPLLAAVARLDGEGFVYTCIFEPTLPMAPFHRLVESVDSVLFAGLTCAWPEHRQRVLSPDRGPRGKLVDPDVLPELQELFTFPALPGRSIEIDTTGQTPDAVAARIASALGD